MPSRRNLGGNPAGHIVPGTSFLFSALILLLVCLTRHPRRGSYHPVALRIAAAYLVGASVVGLLGEILSAEVQFHRPFQAKEHLAMYTCFLLAGFVTLAESKALPRFAPGSWLLAMALATLGEGFLFYAHSIMQMEHESRGTESGLHWFLALSCFFASLCFLAAWFGHGTGFEGVDALLGLAATGLGHQAGWFYFLAHVLYSGDYGHMGSEMDIGASSSWFVFLFFVAAIFVGAAGWGMETALTHSGAFRNTDGPADRVEEDEKVQLTSPENGMV